MESFEEVLKKYKPLIKAEMKKLGIYKNFDDFYQIGAIALWNAYENYDPDKGNFSAYAKAVIRGKMQHHLRKEAGYDKFHQSSAEELFRYIGYEPTYDELELETLKSYLHELSGREITWVYEAIILQKPLSEIAKQYKVSVNTVKTWRKNAIKKLRQKFAPP